MREMKLREGEAHMARPEIVLPPALDPLVKLAHWVVWKLEPSKGGKLTKVPYKGRQPNQHADTTAPKTWCALSAAMRTYTESDCAGIGFVLTDSTIAAIDIDDCRNKDTGELHAWAANVIARAGTYAEVTPSQQGIRVIGLTSTGEPVHCAFEVPGSDVRCELYRRAERYITVTGRQVGDAAALVDIDTLIDELLTELTPPDTKSAPRRRKVDSRWGELNERALGNLELWVPKLFPTARKTRKGGYRVASADLGRGREEDLSLTPRGIKYFGDADMGDPRQGRRPPIDCVMEWGHLDFTLAVQWLEQALAGAAGAEQEKPSEPPEPQGEQLRAEKPSDDPDIEITRLAKLTTLEYEQQRKTAAERLEVRASILDRLVRGERVRLGLEDDGLQGRPISFAEPELWPGPVNGAELLDALADAIRKHVVLPNHARDATALWIVHTYLTDGFLVSPRLCVRSPTKGCGKTLLLDILGRLVLRPLPTANVTPAAVFRVVEAHRPTLLIDEGDTFLREADELRGVLNSGHRKGGTVLRVVGDNLEPHAFSTYAACVVALIGSLPDTLHDRSVVVDLKRRLPSETVEPFRPDRAGHLDMLARQAARWAKDNADRIADADPKMPDGIINRTADNWRPLLAIADVASGDWPQRARAAVAQARLAAGGDEASRLELLLGDIRDAFGERKEMPSADLVETLVGIEGHPWAEMGRSGKPLSQAKLARLLKPLGIRPGNVGPEAARVRGYLREHFEEAFGRYLAPDGGFKVHRCTERDEQGASEIFKVHSQENGCALSKCEKPNNDGLLGTCAPWKGGSADENTSRPSNGDGKGPAGAGRYQLVCEHCGAPEQPGNPVQECAVGDDRLHLLHRHCQREWLDA
jgi:hypothetical protein